MKLTLLTALFSILTSLVCVAEPEQRSQERDWLQEMVDYSMKEYRFPEKYVWDWSPATLVRGLIVFKESEFCKDDPAMVKYLRNCEQMTRMDENGKHPNALASAHILAYLGNDIRDYGFADRCEAMYAEYLKTVRADNGGVSHRVDKIELWDDTIYMIGMFLQQMYVWTGNEKYLNDYIDQLLAHNEKLLDKESGFWVHGWYANSTSDSWHGIANKEQNPHQRSSEFWGRGNGWIMMSTADALSVMPKNHPRYEQVKQIYLGMMKPLPGLQDPKTGHWYQLPIYPKDPENWIESSATAMFGYAICKGLKMGLLDREVFTEVAKKAYNGLGEHSVKYLSDGKATAKNVCTGTVIGDKKYYLARKIVEGEDFALGAFIMFGVEYKLLNESH